MLAREEAALASDRLASVESNLVMFYRFSLYIKWFPYLFFPFVFCIVAVK